MPCLSFCGAQIKLETSMSLSNLIAIPFPCFHFVKWPEEDMMMRMTMGNKRD